MFSHALGCNILNLSRERGTPRFCLKSKVSRCSFSSESVNTCPLIFEQLAPWDYLRNWISIVPEVEESSSSFEVSFLQSRLPNDQGAGDDNLELLKSNLLECLVSDEEVAVRNLICFNNGHFSTRKILWQSTHIHYSGQNMGESVLPWEDGPPPWAKCTWIYEVTCQGVICTCQNFFIEGVTFSSVV